MPSFPWQQFTIASGGWLLFAATVWMLIAAFILGRIFSKSQVDEMIKPRDMAIAALQEERATLLEQNQALLREGLTTQNQFFQEIKSLREQQ